MGDIVNLRQRRKQQARVETEVTAAANRAKFGRPKAERKQKQAEEERAARDLDSKKLDH